MKTTKFCKVVSVSTKPDMLLGTVTFVRAVDVSGEWICAGSTFEIHELTEDTLQWLASRLGKLIQIEMIFKDNDV